MTRLTQIHDVLAALLWLGRLGRHDSWSRAQLERHQQARLTDIVHHAAEQSPFYRQLYRGISLEQEVDLQRLPTIDKRLLMENFDRFVTDPNVRLKGLEDHVGQSSQGELYLGKYRVLVTTGTSGPRGVFVYDRSAWRVVIANTLRWQRLAGVRPRLGKRLRICSIGADHPAHVSRSLPESGNVGLFKLLRLSASLPLSELVAQLNRFQPQVLMPYPSIAALLADEQRSGRLHIRPEVVATHSEALTVGRRGRISETWAVSAFDHYGLTEEPHVACECESHSGLHLFEDLCIIEVLDQDNRPVQPGTLGAKYLLTNLYNRVQPLIRYEVTDRLAMTREPCACGRPFARITQIGGRSEETLTLRDSEGRSVTVPGIVLSGGLEAIAEVSEFELCHGPKGIDLVVVARKEADQTKLRTRLTDLLCTAIRDLGAEPPAIDVAFRDEIPRREERMGKLQSVRAD